MSYPEHQVVLAGPLVIATSRDAVIESVLDPAAIDRDVLALFDQYERPLLRYAWSLNVSAADAEDVVQDAFVALFQHLRRGKSRENLPGWLFQVVRNLAVKRLRRIRRMELWSRRDVPPEQIGPGGDPEELMIEAERRRRWRRVLRAMPERDRRCMLLRAEGLRYRDIASALGVSLGSVAKSMARGLARMASADQV